VQVRARPEPTTTAPLGSAVAARGAAVGDATEVGAVRAGPDGEAPAVLPAPAPDGELATGALEVEAETLGRGAAAAAVLLAVVCGVASAATTAGAAATSDPPPPQAATRRKAGQTARAVRVVRRAGRRPRGDIEAER
jgi:hypothetical protein